MKSTDEKKLDHGKQLQTLYIGPIALSALDIVGDKNGQLLVVRAFGFDG